MYQQATKQKRMSWKISIFGWFYSTHFLSTLSKGRLSSYQVKRDCQSEIYSQISIFLTVWHGEYGRRTSKSFTIDSSRPPPHSNPETCFIITNSLDCKNSERALVIKSLFFVGFHSPYIFGRIHRNVLMLFGWMVDARQKGNQHKSNKFSDRRKNFKGEREMIFKFRISSDIPNSFLQLR